MSELLAKVPYKNGGSFDFYDDYLAFDGNEIDYDIIEGYSYHLQNTSQSVYFIPVANYTKMSVSFWVGGNRVVHFNRSASAAMLIKGDRQKTVELVFSELVKCIEALVAPIVVPKWIDRIRRGESLQVGGITISEDSITKKTAFGQKEMQEYGFYRIVQGSVYLYDPSGKIFTHAALSIINAPILPYLLDEFFGN
jgi:hypothetical protein